jgi:MtN3 and saliva related transmembrane protein
VIELLGILSGCLTTLCWVPQLVRTWRRGAADDISGVYLFTLGTGVTGWLVYGVLKVDVAVIFANAVTLILLIGLVGLKYARPAAASDHPAPVDHPAPEPRRAVAADASTAVDRSGWGGRARVRDRSCR